MPGQDESRAFSICVLESDPAGAAVYSDVFSSRQARLKVFSDAKAAIEYIEAERLDLIIGSLRLSDEFLLEFVDKARGVQPQAALLIMHPELEAEDVAVLQGGGVQAVAPANRSAIAYRQAIEGSIKGLFGSSGWGPKGDLQGRSAPADSLLKGALELEASDIVDAFGGLTQLPDAVDESLLQDAARIAEAVGKVDSVRGLTVFQNEVQQIGKSRAAAALLHSCETATTPEQAWLLISFLSLIPSYTTRLALERLSKTHPNPKARDLAAKSSKALLRELPVIFHAERLLSERMGPSAVSKAAEAIARSEGELAVGLLTRALAARRPIVRWAAIRGLGMVASDSALKVLYRRLRMFRLIRETAFFQESCDDKQHLLDLEALAAILKTAGSEHPEAAREVAQDLLSEDKRTRLKAIEVVGLSRTPSSCEMLSGLVRSPDWSVRMAVLQAISLSPDPRALGIIGDFVNDPNRVISGLALDTLERLKVNDELRKALQDGKDSVKASAAAALGRLSDQDSVGELIRLAFGDDPDTAHEALMSLGKIADESCIPDVEKLLLRSDRPEIIADAAHCLATIASGSSLEALIRLAENLFRRRSPGGYYDEVGIRRPDLRLPLIMRAIGATINSERWKRNDALMEQVLLLFQRAGIISDDAVRLEIAGILLHVRGLSLKWYDDMLTLLERFATRRSDATPQQQRMASISRKAIERLRKRRWRLHELERALDRISQILESLPARPDGERHRAFAALGSLLSAIPQAERAKNPEVQAAVETLLKHLNDPQTAWTDRASAISSLVMLGERRALPMLRELKSSRRSPGGYYGEVGRDSEPHSGALATRAMRSIIGKNLRGASGSADREAAIEAQEAATAKSASQEPLPEAEEELALVGS
ncbi:MAG: HEAT repeat domain-containing protein [Candidatus Coatesbacteria bacterium]|nr:HEAT repeat domain-containing protein [Candidatus Coatesbacteria bacterium]